ncbi:c-type cytochrome [Derxia gummosa]|uniref:C-type cytochrome n=1 Tax=Derxia gummosa DSM 723 TaxID=1121388 RepID=A0A8B6X731_9BURK|nr:cytochrome c [Derxia gummosa]
MKSLIAAALCALGCAALPVHAADAFAKPKEAVEYREGAFNIMSVHMKRLAAMAKGDAPYDAARAESSAQLIATLSTLPWEAFIPGTVGDLKSDPIRNADNFRQLADKFEQAAKQLPASAGSIGTLRGQLNTVGAACKSCHESYRK